MDFTVILYRYPGTCVFDRHEKYQKYMYTYMSCTGRFGSNQTTIFRVMYGFVLLHVCTCTAVQLCSVVVNITLLVKAWKLETLKIVYYIIIYCTCTCTCIVSGKFSILYQFCILYVMMMCVCVWYVSRYIYILYIGFPRYEYCYNTV